MKKAFSLTALLFVSVLAMSFVMEDEWVLCEARGCKIYFPQKPTLQTKTTNTPDGDMKLYAYMYVVPDSIKDDNLVYGLVETEYPGGSVSSDNKKSWLDHFFEGTIEGFVDNTHGKLISSGVIEYEGYPGRTFKVDINDGLAIITAHIYLVKNKVFMIEVSALADHVANKSTDRFMNSFSITK